jgi:hypothetical protein
MLGAKDWRTGKGGFVPGRKCLLLCCEEVAANSECVVVPGSRHGGQGIGNGGKEARKQGGTEASEPPSREPCGDDVSNRGWKIPPLYPTVD